MRTGSRRRDGHGLVLRAARPDPRVRERGDEALDRVLELERALLPQQHRRHRRDRLRHRVDAKQRVALTGGRPRRRAARPWRRARPRRRARSRPGSRAACPRPRSAGSCGRCGQALRIEACLRGVDLDVEHGRHVPKLSPTAPGLIAASTIRRRARMRACCWLRPCWCFPRRPRGPLPPRAADAWCRAGRLGDIRRGRALGGQHQRRLVAHRRARLDRLLRQRRAREAIPGCHRSKSAEVHIGDGVHSRVNLACSGARTSSRVSRRQVQARHRLLQRGGNKGQALALQELAATDKNIKAVVVLIGANDYGFADIVQTCVTDWLTSPSWWKNYCQRRLEHDRDVLGREHHREHQHRARRVQPRQAGDGHRGLHGRVQVRDPRPDLLRAAPARLRHPLRRDRASRARRSAAAASGTGTPTGRATPSSTRSTARSATPSRACGNVPVLDMAEALAGRKLCENTVGLLEEKGVANWRSPAPSTRPSGCTRSARSPRSSRPTSCRRTRTRTTGASWRCATASGRRTTAARRAAARARAASGSNGKGEPNMSLGR